MSSTMLQLMQQTTTELGLQSPTVVASNTSQEIIQLLALMNSAGYELLKEYDWQALEKQYRFYTTATNLNGSCVEGGYQITGLSSTAGLDNTYMVSGSPFPQDTYIVSVDSPTQVTLNQQASATQVDQSILFSKTIYDLPPDYETITNRTQWDKTKHWEMLGPETAQQWQWLKSGYIATGPRVRWRLLGGKFQIWPNVNNDEYLGFEYRSKAWAQSADGTPKNSFTADTDTTFYDDRLMVLDRKSVV